MHTKQLSWRFAWDYPVFRVKLLLGIFLMGLIIFYLQDYFVFIQGRDGLVIEDRLLNLLPAHDVSLYIFLILYPVSGLIFWRARKNTRLCITALWGYIFLCLVRMLTIAMVPLEPPANLVHMTDPFSIIFYGSNMITRDLFFSGHTATLFLVGLCLENKKEKIAVFIATAILGLLLLIQHVHFTADVVAAPFFSYLFWYMGKTVAKI